MPFSVRQSGEMRKGPEPRRPDFEISVADFKNGAGSGFTFWRGVLIGLGAGLAIGYVFITGPLSQLIH